MKKCSACKARKPMEQFHRNKWRVDGRQNQCIACHETARSRYLANNRERVKVMNRKAGLKYYKKNRKKLIAKRSADHMKMPYEFILWKLAKQRAKAVAVPFTISVDDIIVPDRCPALGIPLKRQLGNPSDNSPTIDRIYPALGYTPGNIVIVSYKANAMKRNATPGEIMQVAKFYASIGERQGSAI